MKLAIFLFACGCMALSLAGPNRERATKNRRREPLITHEHKQMVDSIIGANAWDYSNDAKRKQLHDVMIRVDPAWVKYDHELIGHVAMLESAFAPYDEMAGLGLFVSNHRPTLAGMVRMVELVTWMTITGRLENSKSHQPIEKLLEKYEDNPSEIKGSPGLDKLSRGDDGTFSNNEVFLRRAEGQFWLPLSDRPQYMKRVHGFIRGFLKFLKPAGKTDRDLAQLLDKDTLQSVDYIVKKAKTFPPADPFPYKEVSAAEVAATEGFSSPARSDTDSTSRSTGTSPASVSTKATTPPTSPPTKRRATKHRRA